MNDFANACRAVLQVVLKQHANPREWLILLALSTSTLEVDKIVLCQHIKMPITTFNEISKRLIKDGLLDLRQPGKESVHTRYFLTPAGLQLVKQLLTNIRNEANVSLQV